jgi:hypothetical protein
MILNERDTEEGLLVSVCDDGLIGQTFEDGEVSLTVTEEFYGGESVGADRVRESLQRCDVANIVGAESVALAVEAGIVEEGNVLDIDGTRHAQVLWMG